MSSYADAELLTDYLAKPIEELEFRLRRSPEIDFASLFGDLARISHTNSRIGPQNQRKLLCRNDFTQVRGAPDADRVWRAII
jgi:hypothetical protein